MCRPVDVCVIFMVLFSGQPTVTQSQDGTRLIARVNENSGNSLTRDSKERIFSDEPRDFPSGRRKRALLSLGRWATNFLLQGARLVKSNKHAQYYIKPGGYKNTVEDFYSVKPDKVVNVGVVKSGEVGDKGLNIMPSVPGMGDSPPSMMIIHNGDFPKKARGYVKTKFILYGDYDDVMKYLSKINTN